MICRFIDTHCHFDFPPFSGDEEASLQRAAQAGVGKIIVPATEAENFARVQALAEKYQPLYAALGLHPGMLEKHSDVSLDQLQQALERHPAKVVAVGEIGLDHHWPVPRQEQYDLFEAQLQLAKELDLPVSVHDREAHAEMYELLRKYKPRGALHCYSGSADDAAWLVEQGMYLGFGGAVTYKGAKRTARVLAAIPHDRALLETDCPYMAPEPVRGTRNDSRNIVHVAAYIGTLWDMDAQAVLDRTAANARACFGV